MELFDFFNKNKITEVEIIKTQTNSVFNVNNNGKSLNEIYAERRNSVNIGNDVFELIKIYSEYVVKFIGLQTQDNYAPIAAYEKNNSEIIGYLYIGKDRSYNKSAEEVIFDMELEFEKRMNEKSIKSYIIFYHSIFDNDDNHTVAKNSGEFNSISVKYKSNSANGYLGFPYIFEDDTIKFKGFSNFTTEQNASILNTKLIENKDYFQERIIIEPQIIENSIGIKVKKVNNGNVGDMWGGIFGFNETKNDLIINYSALCLFQEPKMANDKVLVSEIIFDEVVFRGVKTTYDNTQTAFPVIKTNIFIEVENKQINEWSNVDNIEGVIEGNGRNTFGLTYFATDYSINKEKYHNIKKHNIELSGIIYHLDEIDINNFKTEKSPNYDNEFTMYMPNIEMADLGWYDFIGKLEDFREVTILEAPKKGYILKIKLINNEDDPNFFTIEMFVNKENMRFETLKRGMKLTGLFQLQGQIKE